MDNRLFSVLYDDENIPATESVFIGKISRINHANLTAFIEYSNGQNGFINLHKHATYQVGSILCTQLTWLGDNTKQPKFRNSFELIGKYIIFHSFHTNLNLKSKHLNDASLLVLQKLMAGLTGTWIIRSHIQDLSNAHEIIAEATTLYAQAKQIELQQQKTSSIKCIHTGTPNYLKILRELNLANGCEVISNDSQINQELIAKQDNWFIDVITFNPHLAIDKELSEFQQICAQNIFYTSNNSAIEYGCIAGIHIFDINNHDNKQTHAHTNLDTLELIYQQIILRNLQGIILLDIIKNTAKAQEQKIIHKLTKLFKQDISHTQILGISHAGLVEIIRNKY